MSSAFNDMGKQHGRRTPRSVAFINFAAEWMIRLGGIFVIVAVLGICVFLVSVAMPLFGTARVAEPIAYRLPLGGDGLLWAEVNEYKSLGMACYRDGTLSVFDARTGQAVRQQTLLPVDSRLAAWSRSSGGGVAAFGLADGRLVLAAISFATSFLDGVDGEATIGESFHDRGWAVTSDGVVERTPLGQARLNVVQVELGDPLSIVLPEQQGRDVPPAIRLVDYRHSGNEEVFAALSDGGILTLGLVSRRKNLLTGSVTIELDLKSLPSLPVAGFEPFRLVLNARGDQVFVAGTTGQVLRHDLRNLQAPVLAETAEVTAGARLVAFDFMFGDQSLLVADDSGNCDSWFRLPSTDVSQYPDGYHLVRARRHEAQGAGIDFLALSPRNKTFATGARDGSVWFRHMTSGQTLARVEGPHDSPLKALQITPKSDALFLARADGSASVREIDCPHPETTPGTIIDKTWYEGYSKPVHTWQSSSGTDDFEPKLGLMPLIFGTLKATVYALLFAVPLALLAAIYTSEMLSRKVRAVVKPTIELMASLPSVVLGFLAALVLAPLAEAWLLSLLTVLIVVPIGIILAAYLWHFLPQALAHRLEGLPKLALIGGVLVGGAVAAFPLGHLMEEWFFFGDFQAWLSPPRRGTGTGFWTGLLFPLGAILVILAIHRWQGPAFGGRGGVRAAFAELAKGIVVLIGALALSIAGACFLTFLGLDPRDYLVGTYVQRNTLVVGFVMGFAVIPIIYTISEDALSAVPEHLRGAALGCGATPWQTAIHVVVPTALSGIFSAIMVGMGRAVGETMIVVMAAGNTPIIDISPFNGLRALSATIAVELPEAVKDGTLYRMLFLAALVLFTMTFVLNTMAEVVRQRFRKRAFQL